MVAMDVKMSAKMPWFLTWSSMGLNGDVCEVESTWTEDDLVGAKLVEDAQYDVQDKFRWKLRAGSR